MKINLYLVMVLITFGTGCGASTEVVNSSAGAVDQSKMEAELKSVGHDELAHRKAEEEANRKTTNSRNGKN